VSPDPDPLTYGGLDEDPGPSPLLRTLRPLVITVVLAVVVLGGFALVSHLTASTRTAEGVLDLEGAGRLEVQAGPADVRVVPGDVRVPRYTARVRSGLLDTRFDVQRVGETVRIDAGCRPVFDPGCGVDVTITVPEDLDVDLLTGSGDVDVSGLGGVLVLRSGSGDVEASALRTPDLTVRTGSGDVDASFVDQPAAVKVDAEDGDVELTLPAGPRSYRVDARSGSGEVESAFGATDDPSARLVRVRSDAGDVEVDRGR
jgi:hypothetical protein